ncbi:hypothetical protein [Bradyrhizobium sp. CB3481]|uniref:hypothetical protein n=1 Tax=Bradyrhizobium sp. CB3481 TaxID=3039158 RepID=UPI0024B25D7A|nr:hypothetical protein [Bradyrhizobium sp. CB3481]WFU18732.1 hypothetical protein QA643_10555 [Bradyrhizobium sp. CB3481]
MHQPIETGPKDGKAVTEDHVAGWSELAQDSAKKGGHCEVAPIYWHAMNRAKQLDNKESSDAVFQTTSGVPASPGIAPFAMVACSDSPSVTAADNEIARAVHKVSAKRRLATLCGVAMVAASLTSMYFRADFATYVARHSETIGAQMPIWTISPPRAANLVFDDTAPQGQTVGVNLPARDAQVVAASAPLQGSDLYERTNALEKELLALRGALAEAQETKVRSIQAAQDASTALQQSLEKMALLETRLELARRHIEQGAISPPRSRRIPRRKAGTSFQPDFFGLFSSSSHRTAHRRSTHIRQ